MDWKKVKLVSGGKLSLLNPNDIFFYVSVPLNYQNFKVLSVNFQITSPVSILSFSVSNVNVLNKLST